MHAAALAAACLHLLLQLQLNSVYTVLELEIITQGINYISNKPKLGAAECVLSTGAGGTGRQQQQLCSGVTSQAALRVHPR